MKRTTKVIAELGIMLAILFVTMTLDRALSAWLPIAFTVITISVVATFAMLRNNPWYAIAAGFFFGLSSFITAFMFGKTTFYNPLVAILPRTFIGITGYGVYRLVRLALSWVNNERVKEYIALSFGGAFTAFSNTIYTLFCMWLFAKGDPLLMAFSLAFLTNILPELIIATIITPLLTLGVRRGLRLGVDGKPRKKQQAAKEATSEGEH